MQLAYAPQPPLAFATTLEDGTFIHRSGEAWPPPHPLSALSQLRRQPREAHAESEQVRAAVANAERGRAASRWGKGGGLQQAREQIQESSPSARSHACFLGVHCFRLSWVCTQMPLHAMVQALHVHIGKSFYSLVASHAPPQTAQ